MSSQFNLYRDVQNIIKSPINYSLTAGINGEELNCKFYTIKSDLIDQDVLMTNTLVLVRFHCPNLDNAELNLNDTPFLPIKANGEFIKENYIEAGTLLFLQYSYGSWNIISFPKETKEEILNNVLLTGLPSAPKPVGNWWETDQILTGSMFYESLPLSNLSSAFNNTLSTDQWQYGDLITNFNLPVQGVGYVYEIDLTPNIPDVTIDDVDVIFQPNSVDINESTQYIESIKEFVRCKVSAIHYDLLSHKLYVFAKKQPVEDIFVNIFCTYKVKYNHL